jgi:hypothetical protein
MNNSFSKEEFLGCKEAVSRFLSKETSLFARTLLGFYLCDRSCEREIESVHGEVY